MQQNNHITADLTRFVAETVNEHTRMAQGALNDAYDLLARSEELTELRDLRAAVRNAQVALILINRTVRDVGVVQLDDTDEFPVVQS